MIEVETISNDFKSQIILQVAQLIWIELKIQNEVGFFLANLSILLISKPKNCNCPHETDEWVTNIFSSSQKYIIKKKYKSYLRYKMSEFCNISFFLLKKYIREEEKSVRIFFVFFS